MTTKSRRSPKETPIPAESLESDILPLFSVRGRMATFGGPQDFGMSPSEGIALFNRDDLQNPRHKDLFLSAQPPSTTGLGRRLNPDKFYIACRWNYNTTPRSFLRNTVAIVRNPANGLHIEARPADWGPNPRTERIADVSPGIAAALNLDTDDIVQIWIPTPAPQAAILSDLNFTAALQDLRIITCDEWGAKPPKRTEFAQNWAEGIVIHNTEGENRPAKQGSEELKLAIETAKGIQDDHFKRRWSDTGQHFTISQGGLILEGRHGTVNAAHDGMVVQGAHAGNARNNERWYGIEICGDNRRSYVVTEQQWKSLVNLCVWLVKRRGVAELPIIGHQKVYDTTCPGLMMDRIPQLRADVRARLRG
jgi:N-acetylmuramoyl-L-alanine amidase